MRPRIAAAHVYLRPAMWNKLPNWQREVSRVPLYVWYPKSKRKPERQLHKALADGELYQEKAPA